MYVTFRLCQACFFASVELSSQNSKYIVDICQGLVPVALVAPLYLLDKLDSLESAEHRDE